MEDEIRMADGDRKYNEIGQKKKYLLASDVFHLNWRQQGRKAVMKSLGLQCLAGQII